MSDTEERVINMLEKRDSDENLQDAFESLRNVEDRDEFTDRLTAEVAYLLMCRAKSQDEYERAEEFGNTATEYIGKVDTSSQAKCKPILSDYLPDLFHEGIIERDFPVRTTR